VAEPPGIHSQAEPGNEIDEILRTFKDLCSFVPKKCINRLKIFEMAASLFDIDPDKGYS